MKKNSMRFSFLLLFFLSVHFIAFSQQVQQNQKIIFTKAGEPMPSPFFKNDEVIASFSAPDLTGRVFNLKDLEGKVVVLNFWFVACAPCVKEIPELNQLVDRYGKRDDIVFLALALDEKAEIEKMIEKNIFNYHIIPSAKEIVQKNYKVAMFPTHVVINKDGKVVFHTSGYNPTTISAIEKNIKLQLGIN
jgi:peroxiredoxin